VISEFQSYVEDQIMKIIYAILFQGVEERMDEVARAMHIVAGEARTIETRLSKSSWLVGDAFSAADIIVFPAIKMLLRALDRREAQELRARLLPLETNFPSIHAWMKRVEALPGYERTVPPHWKEKAPE
jgi:glutathione S-transferase